MEFVHEVTAYLENKPGRLAKICSALAHEKIEIRALTVMDASDRSVLRFVTDDLEPTKKVLNALGTEFTHADVIAVHMENKAGALARVLERLAEEHINIEYAYASSAGAPGKSLGIFHTSNPKRALQVLSESSVNGVDRSTGRRPLHSR
ncbi:ACT domain-containing protein [Singulisphaera sp. PoT]|uniref:ACT domain-containing protein n=1 Tax=Singulisphaera sp. PoT TaxID=3411797 RepID=UPI003BF49319